MSKNSRGEDTPMSPVSRRSMMQQAVAAAAWSCFSTQAKGDPATSPIISGHRPAYLPVAFDPRRLNSFFWKPARASRTNRFARSL